MKSEFVSSMAQNGGKLHLLINRPLQLRNGSPTRWHWCTWLTLWLFFDLDHATSLKRINREKDNTDYHASPPNLDEE